jgi:hypothetical protein
MDGSTECRTEGGAKIVSPTSTVAGTPETGDKTTPPVKLPAVSEPPLTETISCDPDTEAEIQDALGEAVKLPPLTKTDCEGAGDPPEVRRKLSLDGRTVRGEGGGIDVSEIFAGKASPPPP